MGNKKPQELFVDGYMDYLEPLSLIPFSMGASNRAGVFKASSSKSTTGKTYC